MTTCALANPVNRASTAIARIHSAKTYHFLLLVNFEIESVEVLFQPEPQVNQNPFVNLGNFSVSGGELNFPTITKLTVGPD